MNPLTTAEAHFHIEFQKVSATEYRSRNGCPKCGDGGKGARSDRFRLFLDNNPLVWCRRCGFTAFIDNLDGAKKPTAEEIQNLRLRQLERQQEETQRRLTALEQMAKCLDWQHYHNALNEQRREYWFREGIFDDAIERFKLGYCQQCPTDRDRRPSYTIPVWHNGVLRNIRHRLVGAQNGDKYRPHRSGLGAMLFNVDSLARHKQRVILWEGEKKTIVMAQYLEDSANVGTMGKKSWKGEWVQWFNQARDMVIAFDPDALESAHKLGAGLRRAGLRRVRVAAFPCKPDDMINLYNADLEDVENVLKLARSV